MTSAIGSMGSYMPQMDPTAMQARRDEMFAKVDQNGDGSLDKTEFQAMAEKMAERTGESMNVDEMFTQMDANSDGKLDQSELEAGMEAMRPDMPPPPPPMSESDNSVQTLLDMLAEEQEEDSIDLLA